MKISSIIVRSALLLILSGILLSPGQAQEIKKPIKALLVAGGCCHDYAAQQKVISEGIQARANVQVDVWWTDDKSVNPPLSLYDNPDWAKGYDIILHDECAAGNKDLKVMKHILDVHRTIPAVHLHCAMHSFRNGTDQWFQHLGIQSASHGPQEPIRVEFVDKEHPITAPLADWTTIKEELYNNVNVLDAHPLAMGRQIVKRDGKEKEEVSIVIWTNETQGARSFSTTLGHNTETVADGKYLDLITRGLLWACGKLEEPGYLGTAFTGKNEVTFVKGIEQPTPEQKVASRPGTAPAGATLVTAAASSEESGKNNFTWCAVDGDRETRWCAATSSFPQSFQITFDKPQTLTGVNIVWESGNNIYRHIIEGSTDGKTWTVLSEASGNQKTGDTVASFGETTLRFLKVTCTGTSTGGWASIRELTVGGTGLKSLYPKLDEKQQAAVEARETKEADPYAKGGNIPPKIVKISAEEESNILKDVKVPDGFKVSLFSNWQAANYPVYVAAAPNGDLYVSSDGNGSLGREPGRGRVLRLRDKDGDGRADEVTEFVKNVDSPRGLLWDHDRLYLLHPPHISVYFDRDGDGIAEESKKLIDGIAFGFADRPADHTTNGLELGIDGWIYIAGGDFGFLKATGTDGRTLQHRGGGVIRFRPDGSGLEIFATGTRNILGTPMSPLCDLFARDNTNDGGGWDVRFHHLSGLEDHGYPRLYKNFPEEHIHPLADYGGGSGCGSVYLHEPGIPEEWNKAPITCDWGRAGSFHHSVQRQGASFAEITEPQPFIQMTRPTDADVDGNSAVYQASWKGPATFKWEGPEVGYIVRVTPKGYTPDPLPDFEKMSDTELVTALESPSHIRTLTAQRTLLRREPNPTLSEALLALAKNPAKDLKTRVAAIYTISQRGDRGRNQVIEQLAEIAASDDSVMAFVVRAAGDLYGASDLSALFELIATALKSPDPRAKLESIIAIARLDLPKFAQSVGGYLDSEDPLIAHTAFRALALMGNEVAYEAALTTLNEGRFGAEFVLMRIHDPKLIEILVKRLQSEKNPGIRKRLLSVLCRLYQREGEWAGDSWGTRPDTRGPYYQPVTWAESDRILDVLKVTLDSAAADEASFLVKEMSRNRIQSDDALQRILSLAKENPAVLPDAVLQLASTESIPTDAIPLLITVSQSKEAEGTTVAAAVTALTRVDGTEALHASLAGLSNLAARIAPLREALKTAQAKPDPIKAKSDTKYAKGSLNDTEKYLDDTLKTFLAAPKLENHHLALETLAAASPDSTEGTWANAALLALASRTGGSPESREMSQKAIHLGWNSPVQKAVLIEAAALTGNHSLDDRIRFAVDDANPTVSKAAITAAKKLKLQPKGEDKTPLIASLSPEKALETALAHSGGDIALGEAVFSKATCIACHTVSQDQQQKGPYLGTIFETYKRPEIALAILDPNKTIAQGFATNVLTLKDGSTQMGFITDEQGEQLTLRDIAAQEHVINKASIIKRETLPTSMMPPGLLAGFTVHEMGSLLDYLESLGKKKASP